MKKALAIFAGFALGLGVVMTMAGVGNHGVRGGAQRPHVLFVAASDATAQEKATANYVCDANADEVQIQAANDALVPSGQGEGTGGRVVLSSGTFQTWEPIVLSGGVTLEGAGMRATWITMNNANTDCIQTSTTDGGYMLGIKDLTVYYAAGKQSGTGMGIHIQNAVNAAKDVRIDRVMCYKTASHGIKVNNGWGCRITNCIFETCTGYGMWWASGGQGVVQGCFFAYNKGDYGVTIGQQVTFTNNWVYRNQKIGARISGAEGIQVFGNRFTCNGTAATGTYAQLDIGDTADYAVIQDNVFDGNSTPWSKYGITYEFDTATPDWAHGTMVRNNRFYNHTTAAILAYGDQDIRDNQGSTEPGDLGILSESFDHADLVDGPGATGTFTFTGSVPANCQVLKCIVTVPQLFTSANTSTCTVKVGDAGDDDRYGESSAQDVHAATGDWRWTDLTMNGTTSTAGGASTPILTITEDDDATDVISDSGAAGKITVTILYRYGS